MMAQSFITNLAAEWVTARYAPLLFVGLILSGIGTTSLFYLGLSTYRRRRSIRYLLLTVALGALVVRTVVGWGTALGVVPMALHHVLEHGLDCLIAATVLYLVFRSGPTQPAPTRDDK
ncbi:hypothetical protein MW046_14310 (plasmid) [Halocatena salina]|uniref:Uncharacterized protein n=2 Tax=Halocatena salina TaxID=2934340 RepID=A0A8U0A5X9_9EURY|nr:hypothetical protein [Halocatena salina]UPM44575.1 hypothetical protein MW046_14310 [Halocatena salina]